MIDIDGSVGEGGGQILRTALALSMCTGQAFTLTRIRAGRSKPGLLRQHLTCVQAAVAVSGAEVQGAEMHAQQLRFVPGAVRAGSYTFHVGTAGSCTLVLQTVWPALLQAEGRSCLKLGGGTHNPMAPPFHFLARSYAPLMRRLGAHVELTLHRLGFYPAGGGDIDVTIWPCHDALRPFNLIERGPWVESYAECLAPAVPRTVAQRELAHVESALGWHTHQLRTVAVRQNEGPGNALLATLVYDHVTEVFTQFGAKGLSAEHVARELVREVRSYQRSQAVLGPHLADQWALPLALAVWKSQRAAAYTCTDLTPHATTNFAVIERFLPVRFTTTSCDTGWYVELAPC